MKVLEQEFGLGAGKATWIMLKAHVTGRAVVGHYPREEAERQGPGGAAAREGRRLAAAVLR